MRKCFYLLAVLLCAASFSAQAAPGDTTWVQAHNRRLDRGNGFGAYDTALIFPSGTTTYRKIYMIFNLGEYPCPTGAQYCHQWDYTVTNYLMTATDTLEISRLITPYANTGVPRFPSTWNKDYVFDVTDYAPRLMGNAALRIFYSGYSAGFTANVRFAFVEGVPDRNVVGITNLWEGSWSYGRASDPIDNHIVSRTRTAPAGTVSAELKVTVTGHGSDTLGCCEFASHNYTVLLNNNNVGSKAIWKDDCGKNQLYPQGGTWIFDRANWCPGELININSHKLPGITANSNFNIDVDFDPYTAPSSYGSYTVNGTVIYYGAFNHAHDMAIEDIIAPTTRDEHFRENPSGSSPIIRVRNYGTDPLVGFNVVYGIKDSATMSFPFTGTLAPLHDTILVLPALPALKNMSLNGVSGAYTFVAQLVPLAAFADDDYTNNKLSSQFVVAPAWGSDLVITMRTNNVGTGGVGSGVSETSWVITDMANNIIASRTNAAISTTYTDTVKNIPADGFYKLQINDGGCDGLSWWLYNTNFPTFGITTGFFNIKKLGVGGNLPMNGYNYSGTFAHDFGCVYTQYFTSKASPTGVRNVSNSNVALEAYPNPANNELSVIVQGLPNVNGRLELVDMFGRVVLSKNYNAGVGKMDVSALANGVYQLQYINSADANIRTTQKISIAR